MVSNTIKHLKMTLAGELLQYTDIFRCFEIPLGKEFNVKHRTAMQGMGERFALLLGSKIYVSEQYLSIVPHPIGTKFWCLLLAGRPC